MIRGDGYIYCDCCGTEKLAQVVGGNLIIRDRRHGQKHVAVIPVRDLLDRLPEKCDNQAKEEAVSSAKC